MKKRRGVERYPTLPPSHTSTHLDCMARLWHQGQLELALHLPYREHLRQGGGGGERPGLAHSMLFPALMATIRSPLPKRVQGGTPLT